MELRPYYQNEAKAAVLGQWEQGVQRTLLVLPDRLRQDDSFSRRYPRTA